LEIRQNELIVICLPIIFLLVVNLIPEVFESVNGETQNNLDQENTTKVKVTPASNATDTEGIQVFVDRIEIKSAFWIDVYIKVLGAEERIIITILSETGEVVGDLSISAPAVGEVLTPVTVSSDIDPGVYRVKVADPFNSAETTFVFETGIPPIQNGFDDSIPPELFIPQYTLNYVNNPDGSEVTFSVKAFDNVDKIILPSCSPSSGSIFPIGETTVVCTATDSSGNSITGSFTVKVEFVEFDVPIWIKEVAGFWCGEEIDDSAFAEAVEYLIRTEVIVIPATESGAEGSEEIPDWVKNNACWWSEGLITDGDFVNALQFLVKEGIIKV